MLTEKDACLEGVVDGLQCTEIVLDMHPFIAVSVYLRCLVHRVQEQVAEGDNGSGAATP